MRFSALLFGLILGLVPAVASEPGLDYAVKVRLTPQTHRLEVTATVNHPPATHFALNKSLALEEVIADGKRVAFHIDEAKQVLFGIGRQVVVETEHADRLELKYAGEIGSDEQTQLTPDLVELLLNAGWYPLFADTGLANFSFTLTADVPQNFTVVSNARQMSRKTANGRLTTVWRTAHPTFDMVLLASPYFKRQFSGKDGGVEVYYRNLPDKTIAGYLPSFTDARRNLIALYGPMPDDSGVRVVYSPRPGNGGYSRLPLIVFGEPFTDSIMRGEFAFFKGIDGNALMYYGVAHEMAHYWWTVADFNKPDGWIDEAVAEFTAVRLMRARYPADAEKLLASNRQAALAHPDAEAIAETKPWTAHRYLNWYQRSTLMFFAAQDRFGEAAVNRLLHGLYEKFKGTHNATTAALLDEAEQQIGKEGRAFFEAELYRKPALSAAKPADPAK